MAGTNVKTGAYLKRLHDSSVALGDIAVNGNATFVIEGFEHLKLLIKQFPWPELSVGGEIEVPLPNGSMRGQPQQLKTFLQGPVTLMETEKGHMEAALNQIIGNQQARFNAKVYEGTPEDFSRMAPIYDCFFVLDTPDRDFENRGQLMQYTGTVFFHYFGPDA